MQKLAVKAYWEQLTKMSIGEGLKKYGFIHIWVGGWVRLGTISKKNHAFEIHFRPF